MEDALDGLGDSVAGAARGKEPADAWATLVTDLRRDASFALAAVRVTGAREGVSSELIDSLNASVHVRALLTDLFLLDDLLD